MAALGLLLLLLLLGAAVVAPEQQQDVAQESLILQHPHIEQLEVGQKVPVTALLEGATVPHRASPPVLVGFPPPWPVATAVTRHCSHPPPPPTPPVLPGTGFAHLHRQAAALDAFRPRLDACCRHHAPLPCARRAWTDVLDGFCTDEFGVKTRHFPCCRRRGAARRRCFAQGPAAEAAAIVTVTDPIVNVTDAVVTDAEPPFPPGEPTAANMANICGLRRLRPGAPGPNGPSGPRVRLRLRLERDYGRCCHNGSVDCAHDAGPTCPSWDPGVLEGDLGFWEGTQVSGEGARGGTQMSGERTQAGGGDGGERREALGEPVTATQCWRVEDYVVVQECARCSGFQTVSAAECRPTGFIEQVSCATSKREEFKRCRSAVMEARVFWRFVGTMMGVAAVFAVLVVCRQRVLDRKALEKVRKQIESI
ncbi:LOW QUALITY PROTEIN: uncharacterized protein RG961_012575 [Leptosomus discolor]